MNEATAHLCELAARLVGIYVRETQPRAVLLAGSAARGDADFFSDIDLIVYYDELPSSEARAAARENAGGESPLVIADDPVGHVEQYLVGGVACQVAHIRIAAFEAELEKALAGEELDQPHQKVLSGLFEGLPLLGEELIAGWRERSAYPDTLQRAVIQKHWSFFPLWYFRDRLNVRDAVLWRQQILLESAFNLVAVLAALNRVWFASIEFKRTRDLVAKLELVPPRLADRLEALFSSDEEAATAELESLVAETQVLLAAELPDLDLSRKRPPGSREQPWRG
jgi:nucleotidyltransferase-like protein